MHKLNLRYSVRTLLVVLTLFAISFAWVNSLKNKRTAQSNAADFLDKNYVYVLERDADFKRQHFSVVDPGDGQLVLNSLPVRDPSVVRNHWAEIGSHGYDHVYVTDKTDLSSEQLTSTFSKLPWLKSASIHKELYSEIELKGLEQRFPDIEFHFTTLLAE